MVDMEKIGIASDHAGFQYKEQLKGYLTRKGFEVVDFGTDGEQSCDYSDFAHPMACAIEKGELPRGIAICGTGNGMAITLNHHQGIRAGLAWSVEVGKLVKEHNNANVLVLPARFVPYGRARMTVKAWLDTQFAGGRHQRRIDKIPVR